MEFFQEKEGFEYLYKKDFVFPYTLVADYFAVKKKAMGGYLFLINHQSLIKRKKEIKNPRYLFFIDNYTIDRRLNGNEHENYQMIYKDERIRVLEKKKGL